MLNKSKHPKCGARWAETQCKDTKTFWEWSDLLRLFLARYFVVGFVCRKWHEQVLQTFFFPIVIKLRKMTIPNDLLVWFLAQNHTRRVKYSEKANIFFFVFLSPYLLPLTSHRHISLLTGKSYGLSGQWRRRRGSIAEAIQMKVLLPMLVLIRTSFRTNHVVKELNQEFGFNIFLLLRLSNLPKIRNYHPIHD